MEGLLEFTIFEFIKMSMEEGKIDKFIKKCNSQNKIILIYDYNLTESVTKYNGLSRFDSRYQPHDPFGKNKRIGMLCDGIQ
jgi:hypothetical protein